MHTHCSKRTDAQRRPRLLSRSLAAGVLLTALVLVSGQLAVSAQEGLEVSDCTESLGTLSAGDTTRSGTTSTSCTRYLPHGYSYVVDNGVGSAQAFTFTLSSAATVTVTLDHDTTYNAADRPVLELINGHHGHTTAVGTLLTRATGINNLSVPVSVGVALAAGDYTAQLANYNWQWGGAFSYSLTINVADAATGATTLVLSGSTQKTYREDFTSSVANYGVLTDGEDGDVISWALSGDDSSDFSISSGGTLTFATQPDYENPADDDQDNVYEFTVTATRGSASGSLSVAITVTDLDETLTGDDPVGGV